MINKASKISRYLLILDALCSQIAIKQLGTNGGGFFATNSAFPLENPTSFSNFLEVLSIMLIPAALCIAFGKAVSNKKQGISIMSAILVLFVIALCVVTLSEKFLAPQFAGVLTSGSMEGKEVIHGRVEKQLKSIPEYGIIKETVKGET